MSNKNTESRFTKWFNGEGDLLVGNVEMKTPKHASRFQRMEEFSEDSAVVMEVYDYPKNRALRRHSMSYNVICVLVGILFAAILIYAIGTLPTVGDMSNPTNNEVSARYIENGLEETGAINIIAGVILSYRAFDTFGESTVLFAGVCCVMMVLMLSGGKAKERDRVVQEHNGRRDSILVKIASILCPVILLFGIYIVLNGHISPGGGFSGGAIIGAGLILYRSAFGWDNTRRFFTSKTNMLVSFVALAFYGISKTYVFYTGANHIEAHIPLGTPGDILSSGLILLLNICVGAVVACTMYSLYALFRRGEI